MALSPEITRMLAPVRILHHDARACIWLSGTPNDMTAPTHTVRNSLLDKERTFTLGADALCWRDRNGEGQIPYANVREMRLISYTSLVGEAFQCTVRARNDDLAKLRSAHYWRLGDFEDRTSTYAPLVAGLAKRIAANAPGARFVTGSTALWITWLVIGILCAIVVALVILSLFESVPPAACGIAAIAICIGAAPIVIHRARHDRARRFDPEAPPPELLGARSSPPGA